MRLVLFCAGALLSGIVNAQFVMVTRDSDFYLEYLGGYAGDVQGGVAAQSDENLYVASGAGLSASDTRNGVIPPTQSWSYTVTWNLGHQYTVTGSLAAGTRINAQGNTLISSAVNSATVSVRSNYPGNRLQLGFILPTARIFKMKADLDDPGSRGDAFVYVYAKDLFGTFQPFWVFDSASPNALQFRNFGAGEYMVEGNCSVGTDNLETTVAGWKYDLEMIQPEQGALNSVIQGKVVFDSHISDYRQEEVTVEFYNLSNQLIALRNSECSKSGEFGITLPAGVTAGFYYVKLRGDTTLRKAAGLYIFGPGEVTNMGLHILINGDIDADGEIGPSDFDTVVAQFGSSGTNLSADIDGDEEVGPSDFDDVVAHFGMSDQ